LQPSKTPASNASASTLRCRVRFFINLLPSNRLTAALI
jgi:hypothetical protein